MPARIRLGELLVEAGIITRDQLESALERQREDGRRLGAMLVADGTVSETQVTQILSQQLSVPWVSLYKVEFSRELLELVSRDLAEKHSLVPLFVRRVRGLGNTLYVAMDDPTDTAASEAVQEYSGLTVRTMIASASDITSAIRVYYGESSEAPTLAEAEWELGLGDDEYEDDYDDEAEVDEAEEDAGGAAAASVEPEDEVGGDAGKTAPEPEAPELEFEEVELDDQGKRIAERSAQMVDSERAGAPRFIRLTMLDGTTVSLPAPAGAPTGRPAADSPTRWTARDLVTALRAATRGENMAKKLGEDVPWEAAFSALLAVLLKKHLIADWEFVEEYQKGRKKRGSKPGSPKRDGSDEPADEPEES